MNETLEQITDRHFFKDLYPEERRLLAKRVGELISDPAILPLIAEIHGREPIYQVGSPGGWDDVSENFYANSSNRSKRILYASPISQVEGVEAEIIERCAQAAEGVSPRHTECGNKIAAAIRKLAASPSSTEPDQT